ncbi:kinase-like domain-containing protein [Pisolithus marmoratus]|nr:kinase-like domain-containing protein [Pisolithus marmoratus]
MDTVALLAEQLITCLQHIHSHSYIYSNFSPQNILVSPASPGQQAKQIILFKFSLTELYRDPQTYTHVPFYHSLPFNECLPPTAFSSMNYHQHNQLSRWDDLQSLAYLLVYLACRLLPWLDAKALSTHDILQWKQGTAIAEVPFLPTDVDPSDLSYWMHGILLAPATPQKHLCDAAIPSPTPVKR